MNKKLYLILAIIISLAITLFQSLLINSKHNKEKQYVYVAAKNIENQSVISKSSYIKKTIYSEDIISTISEEELLDAIATIKINEGEILTNNDVTRDISVSDFTYLSLKINGDNFNANDFYVNDYVNLYFIPDLEKLEKYQLDWVQKLLSDEGISFNVGKDVGILIKNIQLSYIDKVNQSAQFVSIKTIEPIDRVIAFLQHVSTYEFIKINK